MKLKIIIIKAKNIMLKPQAKIIIINPFVCYLLKSIIGYLLQFYLLLCLAAGLLLLRPPLLGGHLGCGTLGQATLRLF